MIIVPKNSMYTLSVVIVMSGLANMLIVPNYNLSQCNKSRFWIKILLQMCPKDTVQLKALK